MVGVTGASGSPYAARLLRALTEMGEDVDLILSKAARLTIMDETGCRIGDHFVGTSPLGISQVVEVFCEGMPVISVQECPACSR